MEVHEAGGGINYTVEHTKKANEEELYTLLVDRLRRMIKSGKLETNKKTMCNTIKSRKGKQYFIPCCSYIPKKTRSKRSFLKKTVTNIAFSMKGTCVFYGLCEVSCLANI